MSVWVAVLRVSLAGGDAKTILSRACRLNDSKPAVRTKKPPGASASKLFRGGQSYGLPGFETAGHGADVFAAHFLQALSGERGASTSAAMTNDYCVGVGDFFLDVELDGAATHVDRI